VFVQQAPVREERKRRSHREKSLEKKSSFKTKVEDAMKQTNNCFMAGEEELCGASDCIENREVYSASKGLTAEKNG